MLSLAKSTWSIFERFYSTQLNPICVELLKAMDGTNGGNYSLLTAIGIGGQGISAANTTILAGSETIIDYVAPVASVEKVISNVGTLNNAGAYTPFGPVLNTSIPAGQSAIVPFELPEGVTITGAKAEVNRSAGAPASEVNLSIRSYNSSLASTNHGNANVAAGSGIATVTVSGLSVAYTKADKVWALFITGESGGGAGAADVSFLRIVYTVNGLPLTR